MSVAKFLQCLHFTLKRIIAEIDSLFLKHSKTAVYTVVIKY